MRNLGKLLILLTLSCVPLMASLKATVDAQKVVMGETVTLKIMASGDKVKPPALSKVCGVPIISSAQGTSIQAINGNFTKSYTFSYQFMPTTDCRVEPIAVDIDGVEEHTDAIAIEVVPMQISKDSPFILEMSAEKEEVYVGEPFKITVVFKQKRNTDVVDSKFAPPSFSGFWTKEQQQSRRFEEQGYSVSRLHFIVAAQQAGEKRIDPAQIQIATRANSRDAWGQWLSTLKWRSYFSNPLELTVKALPEGVNLVGDLDIDIKADKSELQPNDAVNVTLRISGSGNFEDIGSLKPTIPGVAVYAEEADIKAYIENDEYKGSWTEKYAFVSDRSFTIPSFSIRYFDPKSERIKTLATDPIPIKVTGTTVQKQQEGLTIKRPEKKEAAVESDGDRSDEENSPFSFMMGALFGLCIGVLGMLLPWQRWFVRKDREQTTAPKGDKQVLVFLLQHRYDKEALEFAQKLESLIYNGETVDIDRKQLKKVVKRLSSAVKS